MADRLEVADRFAECFALFRVLQRAFERALRAASDDDIYFYVYKTYGIGFEDGAKVSGIWMSMLKVLREG